MRKVIRLTENDLYNIVQESVNKILKESISSGGNGLGAYWRDRVLEAVDNGYAKYEFAEQFCNLLNDKELESLIKSDNRQVANSWCEKIQKMYNITIDPYRVNLLLSYLGQNIIKDKQLRRKMR
jgi:hypothetical protein